MPLTLDQVARHNSSVSCWVIIENQVYDVTDFLPEHPGGEQAILKYAGRDATAAYAPIHPSDALDKYLSPEKHLGLLHSSSSHIPQTEKSRKAKTQDELRMEKAQREKPLLEHILNLEEMEDVAKETLSLKALSYYDSAADDGITYVENARAFSRFFFRARVMRPISECDISTTILGFKSSIPIIVSGAAFARLGHPLGEANITIGAHYTGIIQMVSANASMSAAEIAAARPSPMQPLFFQLYKHQDDVAARRMKEVEALGYNAIFLTVDAVVTGNREREVRAQRVIEELERSEIDGHLKTARELPKRWEETGKLEEPLGALEQANSVPRKHPDRDMTWQKTIPWLRSITKLPVVIKGIQCVEDAVLATEAGVDGILISNHGGRSLDYSLPSLEVLYKLRQQRPDVFEKTEVYMDGGVRRGTDILKALCLGARAVGLGRPFLYAQSAYGAAGVIKIVRILEREIRIGMQLLGASSVKDLVPEMVERVDWQPTMSKL